MHVEYKPGIIVYVCPTCLEKTKNNFIWLCIGCGKTYFRSKKTVLNRLENSGLENASLLCEGMQLIMGVDMCIECNPEGILKYVNDGKAELEMASCME